MNNIVGWFTTEDGVHVPIKQGQSKVQAMNEHFKNNNYSKYNNETKRKNITQMLNSGEAKDINTMTKNNNPKRFNEMLNWLDTASETHDIELTKSVVKEYLR